MAIASLFSVPLHRTLRQTSHHHPQGHQVHRAPIHDRLHVRGRGEHLAGPAALVPQGGRLHPAEGADTEREAGAAPAKPHGEASAPAERRRGAGRPPQQRVDTQLHAQRRAGGGAAAQEAESGAPPPLECLLLPLPRT